MTDLLFRKWVQTHWVKFTPASFRVSTLNVGNNPDIKLVTPYIVIKSFGVNAKYILLLFSQVAIVIIIYPMTDLLFRKWVQTHWVKFTPD
jgi:hypothetical protein